MKNNTTPKKVWQKPEVSDLDIRNTASGSMRPDASENTYFSLLS